MSKKKAKTAEQRLAEQRRLRAKVRTRSASTRSTKPEDATFAEGLQWAADNPAAVDAYTEVLRWATENPEAAEDLQCFVDSDWAGPMAGIAYPERFNFPHEQIEDVAWKFRAWHILNGFQYTLDWPRPIATMSVTEIIEQLKADGSAGRITLETNTRATGFQP